LTCAGISNCITAVFQQVKLISTLDNDRRALHFQSLTRSNPAPPVVNITFYSLQLDQFKSVMNQNSVPLTHRPEIMTISSTVHRRPWHNYWHTGTISGLARNSASFSTFYYLLYYW
jgi:hypothetical protein